MSMLICIVLMEIFKKSISCQKLHVPNIQNSLHLRDRYPSISRKLEVATIINKKVKEKEENWAEESEKEKSIRETLHHDLTP